MVAGTVEAHPEVRAALVGQAVPAVIVVETGSRNPVASGAGRPSNFPAEVLPDNEARAAWRGDPTLHPAL